MFGWGLQLRDGGAVAEPPVSAPVFASEPGTLPTITTEDALVPVGFVRASGYPAPAYEIYTDTAVPSNVAIFVGGVAVGLPFEPPSGLVGSVAVMGLNPLTDTFDLKMAATNSEGSDVATATIAFDIPQPAPEWSVDQYAVEAPISAPRTFGSDLAVTNATGIEVAGLPNKCIFYKLGVGTPYAVNDEFSVPDLDLLTIASDGDTGAVTGVLKLRALGSSNVDLDITVTIAPPLPPEITERDFEIEEGTEASAGFDTSAMGDSELASIDNQTTGGSAIIVKIPDLS